MCKKIIILNQPKFKRYWWEVEMRFEYPEKHVNQKYKDYTYKTITLPNIKLNGEYHVKKIKNKIITKW